MIPLFHTGIFRMYIIVGHSRPTSLLPHWSYFLLPYILWTGTKPTLCNKYRNKYQVLKLLLRLKLFLFQLQYWPFLLSFCAIQVKNVITVTSILQNNPYNMAFSEEDRIVMQYLGLRQSQNYSAKLFLENFLIEDGNLMDLKTFCVRLLKLVRACVEWAAVGRVQQELTKTSNWCKILCWVKKTDTDSSHTKRNITRSRYFSNFRKRKTGHCCFTIQ